MTYLPELAALQVCVPWLLLRLPMLPEKDPEPRLKETQRGLGHPEAQVVPLQPYPLAQLSQAPDVTVNTPFKQE